jgi:hypothetical protein
MIRQIRTILALPFIPMFYGAVYVAGAVAWLANIIAGDEGLIQFRAANLANGEDLVDEGSDWP